MGKILSSAADSKFPRQMKKENMKNRARQMLLFLSKAGHPLNLLCKGHEKDMFCECEQEKMHTSSQ